jgi:hypothetical protein
MKAVMFLDSDSTTGLSKNLRAGVTRVLTEDGNQVAHPPVRLPERRRPPARRFPLSTL